MKVPSVSITVPELRTLVKERRIQEGLYQPRGAQNNIMKEIAQAKKDELKEMCISRSISVSNNPTVGEMRLRLRVSVIDQGTNDTVLEIGKHAGMTFQEIFLSHPSYIEWAKSEVAKETGDPDWRLRQLVSWSHRMEEHQEVVTEKITNHAKPKASAQAGYASRVKDEVTPPKQEDHVASLERQLAEMRAELAEMRAMNSENKARKKQSTGPMSVSDGSYEEIHP